MEFRNNRYVVAYGTYPSSEPAEVFIYMEKMGNAVADDARDIAVLLSIAMQHGVPLKTMREALCEFDDGSPAGLAGAVLERLINGGGEG